MRIAVACALVLPLLACENVQQEAPDTMDAAPMRWDFHPDGADWTQASFTALSEHGTQLADIVPADIGTWCPAYPEANRTEREAFWTGLLSTLAKHESTWNEAAVGGDGRWFGLVQISPGTARGYGCAARSGEALKSGPANLSCAIRIMAETVPRDGVVAAGGKGVAADWGPFWSNRKRDDMIAWTRVQPYCTG